MLDRHAHHKGIPCRPISRPVHVPLTEIGTKAKKIKKDKEVVVILPERQPEHLGHQNG